MHLDVGSKAGSKVSGCRGSEWLSEFKVGVGRSHDLPLREHKLQVFVKPQLWDRVLG